MKTRKQVQANEYWKPPARQSPFLRDLSLTYEGQTEGLSLRSTDISSNGMFISTSLRFPEGAVLKLRFRLTRTNVEIATRSEVVILPRRTGLRREICEPAAPIRASQRKRDPHGTARRRTQRQRPDGLTLSTQRIQPYPARLTAISKSMFQHILR